MANINEFLENYKDGVPVSVSIDTVSAITLAASLSAAGLLIIIFAKLFK